MIKNRLSFRGLIILLFVGTMIPMLIVVGLVVFRLQQTYLINESQNRLTDFVEAGVDQYVSNPDLTLLAINLGEHLRVLGADMFIQDASGNPVPPSLGTGPWLDSLEHESVRVAHQSKLQTIGTGSSARIVYLAAVIDQNQNVLGSIEASLPMANITDQLNALRQWLILIITIASALAILLAIPLSGIITRPLNNFVDSVERVKQGDMKMRAPIPEVKELSQLAVTYNQMLDHISDDFLNQTRLTETMRRFAADASHELRSPLSVFRNSVDLLQKAVSQNDQKRLPEILAILRQEVDTMSRLVDNLLLLARLDQHEGAFASMLQLEEIDPLPFLEEIYERSRILARGQQVDLLWPTDEIKSILADREMLRRALNNIIENAIIYTPVGKKITLSVENQGNRCCFIIQDQGSGIAPNELERIYDRFYRSDESRNRRIPGTGLGLSIVASIVRAHGGEIKVESQLDQGTCFRIYLKQIIPTI